jgi:alanine racemase
MAGNPEPSAFPAAFVDLSRLRRNFRLASRLVGAHSRVAAMVKADAYGHGLLRVAAALRAENCEIFGVATAAEAQALRESVGASVRIIIFGGLLPEEIERAVGCAAEVIVDTQATVDCLQARAAAAGRQIEAHVMVDTGMRRLGLGVDQALGLAEHVATQSSLNLRGIGSHFAHAEAADQQLLTRQLAELESLRRAAADRGLRPEFHAANSAAVLAAPSAHLDMVRPGLMLYGLSPRAGIAHEQELVAAMGLVARIVRVAEVGAGEGIGYGHSYVTSEPSRIATVRIGYGDGYPRGLSNCGVVLVNGRRASVVGRVCMDHIMVDVTGLEATQVGDEVVLWGEGLKAEEVAELANTISYELVTRVGGRVERRYDGED